MRAGFFWMISLRFASLSTADTADRYVAWTRKKGSDTAEDIAKTAEGIARSLAIQYGQVGFSTWALTSSELKEDACPQCMSLANSVGQTLNVGTPYSEEKLTELKSFFNNKIHALCLAASCASRQR